MWLQNQGKLFKYLMTLILIVSSAVVLTGNVANAELEEGEDEQEIETVEEAGNALYRNFGSFGPYKDEERRYYEDIDVITYEEQQEVQEEMEEDDSGFVLNPITWVKNFYNDASDDFTGQIADMITSVGLMIVSVIFEFNITMTQFTLIALDVAMDGQIMNVLINLIEDTIESIAGIDADGNIAGTGLFNTLGTLFAIMAAVYMVYLFLIKRAPIAAIKSAGQTMLAVLLAMLFVANAGDILRGVNNITNEVSQSIATATLGDDYDNVGDFVHETFVHKPYLFLNFDSADEEAIGEETVEAFLLNNSDSTAKREAIKEEYRNGNEMVTPGNMVKRITYSIMFHGVNAMLSLPIWIFSFILFGLQLYFVVMAAAAPFYLIMAMLPNQGGIMLKYGRELLYPMAFKLFVSFLAMIVFTIQSITFAIPTGDGLTGYFISVFIQIVIYLVIFMFRRRLLSVFSASKGYLKEIGQSRRIATDPLKRGVSGTSTALGMGIGAIAGGPAGAMAGASIGRSVGKGVTGDQNAMATATQLIGVTSTAANTATSKGSDVAEGLNSKKGPKNTPGSKTDGEVTKKPKATDKPDTNKTDTTDIKPEDNQVKDQDQANVKDEGTNPSINVNSDSPSDSENIDPSVVKDSEADPNSTIIVNSPTDQKELTELPSQEKEVNHGTEGTPSNKTDQDKSAEYNNNLVDLDAYREQKTDNQDHSQTIKDEGATPASNQTNYEVKEKTDSSPDHVEQSQAHKETVQDQVISKNDDRQSSRNENNNLDELNKEGYHNRSDSKDMNEMDIPNEDYKTIDREVESKPLVENKKDQTEQKEVSQEIEKAPQNDREKEAKFDNNKENSQSKEYSRTEYRNDDTGMYRDLSHYTESYQNSEDD